MNGNFSIISNSRSSKATSFFRLESQAREFSRRISSILNNFESPDWIKKKLRQLENGIMIKFELNKSSALSVLNSFSKILSAKN